MITKKWRYISKLLNPSALLCAVLLSWLTSDRLHRFCSRIGSSQLRLLQGTSFLFNVFFSSNSLETATTISLALGEVATVANLAIALKKDSSQRNQHHRTSHACGMPWRLNRRLRWYHVRRVPGSWKASLEDARVTRPSRATTWSSPRR
jgi:hypothetical protein